MLFLWSDLSWDRIQKNCFFSDLAPPLAVVCPSSHRQHCLYKVHTVSYIVNIVSIFCIASPRAPIVLIFDIFLPDLWSDSSSRYGLLLLTGQTTWLPPIQFETHLTSYLGMSSKNGVFMVRLTIRVTPHPPTIRPPHLTVCFSWLLWGVRIEEVPTHLPAPDPIWNNQTFPNLRETPFRDIFDDN